MARIVDMLKSVSISFDSILEMVFDRNLMRSLFARDEILVSFVQVDSKLKSRTIASRSFYHRKNSDRDGEN